MLRRFLTLGAATGLALSICLTAVRAQQDGADSTNDAAVARRVFGDVNAPRPIEIGDGETRMLLPLEVAAVRDEEAGWRMLRALKAAGADLDRRDPQGQAAIHVAAMFGAHGSLKTLLELGADPDLRDDKGDTALIIAAGKFDTDALDILLEHGAAAGGANEKGETALLRLASTAGMAMRYTSVDAARITRMVRRLLAAGADPDAADESGRTPLHHAVALATAAAEPVVGALLKAGADPARADAQGKTPLHLAIDAGTDSGASIRAQEQANATVVRLLLDAAAPIDARDSRGRTALFAAAERACAMGEKGATILSLLLERGADITVQDMQGRSILEVADCPLVRERIERATEAGGLPDDPKAYARLSPERQLALLTRNLAAQISDAQRTCAGMRTRVRRAGNAPGPRDTADARRRADLFDRFRNELLGLITLTENGADVAWRTGRKIGLKADRQALETALAPLLSPYRDKKKRETLRAEYYWAEANRDYFRLLADHPGDWHHDEGSGRIAAQDEKLRDKLDSLAQDIEIFSRILPD